MVEIIWTETALADIEEFAEYIALSSSLAAKKLVQKIFDKTVRLIEHPESGNAPLELKDLGYREILVNPVRVIYKIDNDRVYIIHIARQERLVRNYLIQEEAAAYAVGG